MALRLVVTFQAKTGMGADFAAAFEPQRQITLREAGCEQYELFRSQADPDKLVLLERWTSQEMLDAHLEAMRARGGSPTAPFRDEIAPPGFERYEV
jgi:quinol monooxygenase YgiN